MSDIKTETARLATTQEDKIKILVFFTKNEHLQSDAFVNLALFNTDKEKLDYLKALLSDRPAAGDLEEMSEKLCGKIENVRNELGTQVTQLRTEINELVRTEINGVRTEINGVRTEINELVRTEINKLGKEINGETKKVVEKEIEKVKSELGNVYELSARSEISKTLGHHYSSKFKIQDINGLVRLALPRKKFPSENPEYDSQISIQEYRANKVSNYIYNKQMRDKLKSSINLIRTSKKSNQNRHDLADRAEHALRAWEKLEKRSGSAEHRKYLANTPSLSIMLITSYILDAKLAIENNLAPFYEEIEMDVRGKASSYGDINDILVEVGEIKSSNKMIDHGYKQLLLRLAALGFTIEAMNTSSDGKVSEYRCNLVGNLFVPKIDKDVQLLPDEWTEGVTFPDSAKYTVKLVEIGDKP